MKIYAENYRGFKSIEIDLSKVTFILGDNSSGKSSILYLIDALSRCDLNDVPSLDESFGLSKYDYFSPYFENSDVTFAFSSSENEETFVKMLTVKMRKEGTPIATKCSYLVDGKLVTFLAFGNNVKSRVIEFSEDASFEKISELHKKETGFNLSPKIKNMLIGNPSMIFASMDYKDRGLEKASRIIFDSALPHVRPVSPTRALPEKFYSFNRKFDAQGLHFATMWIDFLTKKDNASFLDIDKFGQESGLFEKISVERISRKVKDSPLIVYVNKNGTNFVLHQVGVGVSQVVPVLVETVFAQESGDTLVLVQQPELHLHPIAQAALGSYFYSVAKKGLRGVLETHSSYLLDRFRADLRDGNRTRPDGEDVPTLKSDDVLILFCTNSSNGNIARSITIEDDGSISGEPEEYHKFFVDEYIRTMF